MRKMNPNSIRAAKENCKRFWTDPSLRKKNIEERKKSKLFKDTHTTSHLHTPEMMAKAKEAQQKSEKFWEARRASAKKDLQSPMARAKLKESLSNSEPAKAAFKRMRAALSQSPICQQGPQHHQSRKWHLRSPSNVEFHFLNLSHFIRENRSMFLPEDPEKNIYRGLSLLRPTNKKRVPNSWKGWTWISYIEVFNNDGDDLLERCSGNGEES